MSAIKGNPEFDFKDQNPIISTCSAFTNVYKNNKPEIASKICWAMYMIEEYNAEDNPYARITERGDRIKEIQKSYYKVDTESEVYKDLVSDYSKFILTKEEALYAIHMFKFEELTAYLKELDPSDNEQYKKYINIMDKLPNFWKGLQIVKDNMIESQNKNRIRGNAQLSVREKRRK